MPPTISKLQPFNLPSIYRDAQAGQFQQQRLRLTGR